MADNDIVKHAGGRPTKYIPDVIIPKTEAYILTCNREQTQLPTVEGLSLALEVDPDTMVEWSKKYPKFSATIKKMLMKQKIQLMNDGMYGGKEVNAGMAVFLLKVNHGMRENDPIPPNQILVVSPDEFHKMFVKRIEPTNEK